MSPDLLTAVSALVDRLVVLGSDDAGFRAQLRQLARAVLEATEASVAAVPVPATTVGGTAETGGEAFSAPGDGQQPEVSTPPASPRVDLPAVASPPLPELTLGRSVPPVSATVAPVPAAWYKTTSADIPLIVARCHLKAEGARWAATRCRLLSSGATFSTEIGPRDKDIITRARSIPDCFLWMCHPSGPSTTVLTLYDDIAGGFEALAAALAVVKQIEDESDGNHSDFEQSLDLLAEAQSALRAAIDAIDGPSDSDQFQVLDWLRTTGSEKQLFIRRHMRADDPADPTRWADLSARIEAVEARIQKSHQQGKQRKKLLGKVRHKLSGVAADPQATDWQGIVDTVEELLAGGLPATNRELRGLLAPVIDSLPDIPNLPKGFQLVVREIDRFLATSPTTAATVATTSNAEVEKVAGLLEGKSMVLIGGDCRSHARDALKAAFRLNELVWVETREHESLEGFKPVVGRPDVAVVLLAIRWSSHSYGEIKERCEQTGKPLVRLPGGYSTNQVASQILQQCSAHLVAAKRAD